ncbi:uncharacterized protein LOC130762972 isoform X2 [Actinidia eriantha]|nr:uncharacterized protein LOC130762972 isoform X2 [Actinidia eriantha]
MGTYLTIPKSEKESEDGENERLKYGSSSMQGWRSAMEDAGNLFSFYELCGTYKWTIHDETVLSFQVAERLNDDKSAGRTEVAVAFSCDFVSSGSHSHSQGLTLRIHLYGWCPIFLLFLEHQ